ncbi:hypothetical protein ACIA49_38970 [Kribbella sp. NPDC051587]|uniref:hypothetical protein n=1 Tax=Kribbella sp. NPDC051587 TaxID=3364119 RepID=UPI003795BFE7
MTEIEPLATHYFAADWDWDASRGQYAVMYGAVRFGPPGRSGATPVVTRDVLETIALRENHRNHLVPESDQLVWVGDQVCARREGDPGADIWISPGADGTFDLAPLDYVWTRIEWDDLCDEPCADEEGQ